MRGADGGPIGRVAATTASADASRSISSAASASPINSLDSMSGIIAPDARPRGDGRKPRHLFRAHRDRRPPRLDRRGRRGQGGCLRHRLPKLAHGAALHEPSGAEVQVVGWTGWRKGLPMITVGDTRRKTVAAMLIEAVSSPPMSLSPEQARVQRIARQLLVAGLGDQHLLLDLDALVPAEPADIAFHAEHHAGLEHAVGRVVGPVGGVRQRRVFVGQADAVIEHAVARRKAIRRRVRRALDQLAEGRCRAASTRCCGRSGRRRCGRGRAARRSACRRRRARCATGRRRSRRGRSGRCRRRRDRRPR